MRTSLRILTQWTDGSDLQSANYPDVRVVQLDALLDIAASSPNDAVSIDLDAGTYEFQGNVLPLLDEDGDPAAWTKVRMVLVSVRGNTDVVLSGGLKGELTNGSGTDLPVKTRLLFEADDLAGYDPSSGVLTARNLSTSSQVLVSFTLIGE